MATRVRPKPKLKLKKGDRVQVIQGKDVGKTGEVAHVFPERNMVIVESAEGINVSKKHQKPTRVSNMMLICGKDGPVKVGYRVDDDGNKIRVCRKCGAML